MECKLLFLFVADYHLSGTLVLNADTIPSYMLQNLMFLSDMSEHCGFLCENEPFVHYLCAFGFFLVAGNLVNGSVIVAQKAVFMLIKPSVRIFCRKCLCLFLS